MKVNISSIENDLIKLKNKNKPLFEKLIKKINQISKLNYFELQHFKNLKAPLNEYKRVHVGSFVLTFKVKTDEIIFGSFSHHDDAYKN